MPPFLYQDEAINSVYFSGVSSLLLRSLFAQSLKRSKYKR